MKIVSHRKLALTRLLLVLLVFLVTPSRAASRKVRILHEMNALAIAASLYRGEYGQFPAGTTPEIARALTGENSRGIVFVDLAPRTRSKDGGYLDQWNTPYLITFPDSQTVNVRSAGPDRVFDTGDDRFLRKGVRGVSHNVNTRRADIVDRAMLFTWTILIPVSSLLLFGFLLFWSIRSTMGAATQTPKTTVKVPQDSLNPAGTSSPN